MSWTARFAQPVAADCAVVETRGDSTQEKLLSRGRRCCSPAVTCLVAKHQFPPAELILGQDPCGRPHHLSPASPHRLSTSPDLYIFPNRKVI
ncbi:hypothetical protein AV530_002449 [Patagioenas fasciata monilis]|uniref:Uncharacterized protein n=1 Tax=Patagioenas fasciata monilis TaxID=372326 RepID=A0A1V4K6P5_PATFA|nr:hypothetical protein AV530_002449 [Patagioenas fasciata monilis]